MSLEQEIKEYGERALAASRKLATFSEKQKNAALIAMADSIASAKEEIKTENQKDLAASSDKLNSAMLDRLELTDARIDAMVRGIYEIAELRDPVGQIIKEWQRPNGLKLQKVRSPIGVIGIVYESRPNVTADAAALCIKSSNAVILRGGSESIHSNRAIAKALVEGGVTKGLPESAIQLIDTTDREAVKYLVRLVGKVDLIIPRGGEGLIQAVTEMAHVPVIKHYKGVCHVYVDSSADLEMALSIAENSKCQRPGVCNAMETLLVNQDIAADFLPVLAKRLNAAGVELRGDESVSKLIDAEPATEEDWEAEYLDLILAIRIVPDLKAAVGHINHYGSHHTDAIVTSSESSMKAFTAQVDSSTVFVNASTRFTDGAEFGMGAEMGISTDKLHARGPMGVEDLTTYKYVVWGKGQVK